MKTGHRIFWLVVLCFFMTGCGGYRAATLPLGSDSDIMECEVGKKTIKPGDDVRVTTVDGERVKGRFVSSDRDSVVINELIEDDEDNLMGHYTRRALSRAGVEAIEVYSGDENPSGIAVAFAMAILIGAAVTKKVSDDLDNMLGAR